MSSHRMVSGMAAILLVVLAGTQVMGQENELRGMQIFEPADVRPYGNWAQPREGFFFDFDGIYWRISAPTETSVGYPDLTREVFLGPTTEFQTTEENTLDTGHYRAKWRQGNRIDFGYIGEHHGWLVNTLELNQQTQHLAANGVPVVFNDPVSPAGTQLLTGNVGTDVDGNIVIANVPVVFDHVSAVNRTKLEGVEVGYLYRPHQLHGGTTVEWLLGGRYVYLRDRFTVDATGGPLADSFWNTEIRNRIVGPELGLRLHKPFGRFALSGEGRFMAGLNSQAAKQTGVLGSTLTNPPNVEVFQPLLFRATGFNNSADFYEFTPLVELRVEAHVQITRLISAKVGYTAIWMDGIARASDMVNYTVPGMGITEGIGNDGNHQDMLVHGLNIGIELNR